MSPSIRSNANASETAALTRPCLGVMVAQPGRHGAAHGSWGMPVKRVGKSVRARPNGAYDCVDALWGPVSITAVFANKNPSAALTAP